jgi:hypothetical protein
VLRAQRPDAHRPFRVPFGPVFPVLGIVSCAYLMLSLPVITWIRFLGWLDLGMIIYWLYGRRHSVLVNETETNRRNSLQAVANFVTVFGLLMIFNAACIFILGLMTEVGLTNETTARWAEINVTAEEADAFGLRLLVVSIAVYVVGFVLTKVSGEKSL